ncbi:hypothetical protein Pyn_15512 [Prunus yedoensis var. nudiflora]|uniref:Uncharacterized protein n=1 Tax=Prunus yedoensis var. nudiflora TaxID=2094558 RepID=A0A314YQJ3_PRUYE|nr:hypothetical protein Pyn_15512 [Prunus yedoensis var. nudiflora]
MFSKEWGEETTLSYSLFNSQQFAYSLFNSQQFEKVPSSFVSFTIGEPSILPFKILLLFTIYKQVSSHALSCKPSKTKIT